METNDVGAGLGKIGNDAVTGFTMRWTSMIAFVSGRIAAHNQRPFVRLGT